MRFSEFDTLTFDVVGTLIDFETGILDWFQPTLRRLGVSKTDEEVLTLPNGQRRPLTGTMQQIVDDVKRYEELGVRFIELTGIGAIDLQYTEVLAFNAAFDQHVDGPSDAMIDQELRRSEASVRFQVV